MIITIDIFKFLKKFMNFRWLSRKSKFAFSQTNAQNYNESKQEKKFIFYEVRKKNRIIDQKIIQLLKEKHYQRRINH